MKKTLYLICCFLFMAISISAQTRYYDATEFKIIGKGDWNTESPYYRLPSSVQGKTRGAVWALGTNSAGIAVRFRSNSKFIAAKWETVNNHMNHMSDTGTKGLDLYALKDGKWQYVITGRPNTDGKTETNLITGLDGEMREYMLYLPLYDTTKKLEIGVDSTSIIEMPKINSPKAEKTVIVYGTSITQGGCANRPGMCYTSILSRKLDCNFVNLGFSGNGQLDLPIAEVMANAKADCFVLDCLPNCTLEQMDTLAIPFIKIIREKHPNTPIILVETVIFPFAEFQASTDKLLADKNVLWNKIYTTLKKGGDKNIYYLKTKGMIGYDQEATVDGIHFTDLGFLRFADHAYPMIKRLVK